TFLDRLLNWDEKRRAGRWLLQIWDRGGGGAQTRGGPRRPRCSSYGSSGARLPPVSHRRGSLAHGTDESPRPRSRSQRSGLCGAQEVLHPDGWPRCPGRGCLLQTPWLPMATAAAAGEPDRQLLNEARRSTHSRTRIFMEAAGGDTGKFNCRHSQTGFVSAVKGKRNGGETSEIRVRCDCPPQTLLATLAHSLVEASCSGVAGRGLDNAELEIESAEEPYRPVLLAQIGECRHQIRSARNVAHGGVAASLQLISGRIFLRGDILLVSGAGQSRPVVIRSERPPSAAAMAQRSDLFAPADDGWTVLVCSTTRERSLLQLGSQQSHSAAAALLQAWRPAVSYWTLLARQLSNLDPDIAPPATRTCPAPRPRQLRRPPTESPRLSGSQ
uniref:RNase_PH domain-containing protein n=1 Tax=Macrostomum lignano TaxID=282301 RepID=A0A1I8FR06_9PLAT